MKKFLITEEEKKHILSLHNLVEGHSQIQEHGGKRMDKEFDWFFNSDDENTIVSIDSKVSFQTKNGIENRVYFDVDDVNHNIVYLSKENENIVITKKGKVIEYKSNGEKMKMIYIVDNITLKELKKV